MKKYFKIGLIILLAAFIVIQFFRPKKNIDKGIQANHITAKVPLPDSVKHILSIACFDCHSNNTRYPWYAEIMPVGWFLNNHIVEGKRKFNFDAFATYPPKKALKKLEEVAKEVEEGEMPLNSYLKIHKDAKLSDSQKKTIITWANASIENLKNQYKDTLKLPELR